MPLDGLATLSCGTLRAKPRQGWRCSCWLGSAGPGNLPARTGTPPASHAEVGV